MPALAVVVFRYTRSIKKASREVRKKEGEIVSVIQEVLIFHSGRQGFCAGGLRAAAASKKKVWRTSKSLCVHAASKPDSSPLVEMIVGSGHQPGALVRRRMAARRSALGAVR